jgi:hypothetical protein
MIDISNLDKALVLAALYNASKPQGLGLLHFDPKPMTREEAQQILDERNEYKYFDYLKGRVMKVDISGDNFDPYLYDRDNGQGTAQKVVDNLTGDKTNE